MFAVLRLVLVRVCNGTHTALNCNFFAFKNSVWLSHDTSFIFCCQKCVVFFFLFWWRTSIRFGEHVCFVDETATINAHNQRTLKYWWCNSARWSCNLNCLLSFECTNTIERETAVVSPISVLLVRVYRGCMSGRQLGS